MTKTIKFNIISLKQELVNRLRSHFITIDPKERVITKTKSFTYDGNNKFKLDSNISCVTSVKVQGVTFKYGEDYFVHWRGNDKGSVEITRDISTDDLVEIEYGEIGTGNMVYPDFPRSDLDEDSYPRIGFRLTIDNRRVGGSGHKSVAYEHEVLIQIKVIDTNTYNIDEYVQEIYDFFATKFNTFYNIPYIDPETINEFDDFSDNMEKNHSKIISFRAPHKIDVRQLED